MADLPARQTRIVHLTDDEAKALEWAARHGAAKLRAEGWKDMARNADILDRLREKVADA